MAGLLEKTVRQWASTPFVYGQSCCGVSILRYVESATGKRLTVQPTHSGRRTAQLLLALNFGFVRYASAIMAELGCDTTEAPEAGDVGLLDIPGMGVTACLCLGKSWAAKGDYELLSIADIAPIKAWKVPQCHKR